MQSMHPRATSGPRCANIGLTNVGWQEGHPMSRRPVLIDKARKSPAEKPKLPACLGDQPPPEEQLGGGDICSLEEQPSTEDDKPLD
jgi:hypothetical protein